MPNPVLSAQARTPSSPHSLQRTYVESPQLPNWCGEVEVLNEGRTLEHIRAVHLDTRNIRVWVFRTAVLPTYQAVSLPQLKQHSKQDSSDELAAVHVLPLCCADLCRPSAESAATHAQAPAPITPPPPPHKLIYTLQPSLLLTLL
jgi:hypothetical protein